MAAFARPFAILFVVAGLVVAGTAPAEAAPGPGTFTRITTPSAITRIHAVVGINHLTVSGNTSPDVTSIDLRCVYSSESGIAATILATAVPVSAGAFSVVTSFMAASAPTNCRLRAIPTGTASTSYLGSYSGPILYADVVVPLADGAMKTFSYLAYSGAGSGVVSLDDVGSCAVSQIATIEAPAMQVVGAPGPCPFGLPAAHLAPAATSSSIRVSGHNAYVPSVVHYSLIGTYGLTVAQTSLTLSSVVAANGDMTVTESQPLARCSVSDVFPPTTTSCPALVSSGVKLTRTISVIRGAQQVRIRDTFSSTDGLAHVVGLEYQQHVPAPATGVAGFVFPHHSTTLAPGHPDEAVTGLSTTAASMLVRSDLYAVSADPTAATTALSWSRAPSAIVFAHDSADSFDMRYSLTVPAAGAASLGFAESYSVSSAGATSLGNLAVSEMMATPSITTPTNGAVIGSTTTTVGGKLAVGANGLPVSVVVNGHAAAITKTSATTATYRVTFAEPAGKHTITVAAHDVAGNTKTASISVTNL